MQCDNAKNTQGLIGAEEVCSLDQENKHPIEKTQAYS